MLTRAAVEPQLYRDAMARFAGAVHVVATDGTAGPRGVTVIAACSVSDQPPTILVCVNARNAGNALFLDNGVFALNTLSAAQQEVSVGFSGLTGLSTEERFRLGRWTTLATGAPVLGDALAAFDCELVEAKQMATHYVLFGQVAAIRIGGEDRPLVYHGRAYHVLSDQSRST
jgi:cob(II)yrinic acid a,c-diamide reductase